MQTIQQRRAAYALKKVENATSRIEDEKKNTGGAKDKKKLDPKEFKSYAASFPSMIRMNGLGQAAVFYFSKGTGDKGNAAYGELYNLLSEWLKLPEQPYAEYELLKGITDKDAHAYRLAQAEALLLLDWVKKFAKAYMADE